MPQIHQYEQRTQTPIGPGPALQRPGEVYYDGSALKNLGNTVVTGAALKEASDEEHARAWSASAVSGARLHWIQQYHDRTANAEPGAPDFSPNFVKDYDEYANKLLETAPTKKAKAFLQSRLSEMRGDFGNKVMEFEAQARIDWRSDQFTQAVDNTAKLMNTDPTQYPVALAEQLAVIDSAAIPPVKKSALRQAAIDKVSKAAVWSQIQKSPDAFLDSIGFGPSAKEGKTRKSSGDLQGITGNTAFDALPVEVRGQMFEQAIRLKVQMQGDVERLATRQAKLQSENAEKEVWAAHADGKLTREFLEARRPLLSGAEYGSFIKLMEKPERSAKSDPGTYRELQKLLYSDPAAAVEYAFNKHRQGLLSDEHLGSAVGQGRTMVRQEGPKSPYERGTRYIVDSLDPGPFVQDPIGKSRYADAIDTFNQWAMSGKRTDKEIDERAHEIVGQYRMFSLQDTVIALPQPRSGKITRQAADPAKIVTEVKVAGDEARRRRDNGTMTSAEYENEMAILAKWLRAGQGKK